MLLSAMHWPFTESRNGAGDGLEHVEDVVARHRRDCAGCRARECMLARATCANAPSTRRDARTSTCSSRCSGSAHRVHPEAAAVHYPLPTTQSIYFDLDDAALPKAALDELSNFGFRLLARPDLQLLIEGFCDERGSTEYNIALGQRRADAAKNYLITFGVPSTRIRAMSWGKDKPKAVGHNEQAWKLNRRIDFTVKG